jgi:catechol 2,3-dioxygenase-like lactoylglutathione lyase family enzyme
MASTIRHVTIDCADPYRVASFWAEVLGSAVDAEDEPGDDDALVSLGDDQPGLLFIRVPEAKAVKNRIHFDLQPQDRTRDEEIDRLVGLGATHIDDRRKPDGRGWMVMADPEGNELCVELSAAERQRFV